LDLKALTAAADESDLKVRWSHLQGILDLDRFFSFMALEIMLVHRDGYCLAGNNYRIYHDPEAERLVFLPHGMDQLFGRADLRLRPAMSGPVARSLMEFPPARRLYRARAEVLFTNAFQAEGLSRRVDQLSARVRGALAGKSVQDFDEQIVLLKSRVASRLENLSRQFGQPEPAPLRFTNSFVRLSVWRPVDVPQGGKLDHAEAPDKRPALHILAGLVTSASWRSTVLLESGRYRFEGRARTSGVKPMKFGRNKGAGLRVSSARLPEPHQLVGDSPWIPFNVDFDLTAPETELELICELRASAGDVWFDLESLKLSKR
jgi:hypothetical protein